MSKTPEITPQEACDIIENKRLGKKVAANAHKCAVGASSNFHERFKAMRDAAALGVDLTLRLWVWE